MPFILHSFIRNSKDTMEEELLQSQMLLNFFSKSSVMTISADYAMPNAENGHDEEQFILK